MRKNQVFLILILVMVSCIKGNPKDKSTAFTNSTHNEVALAQKQTGKNQTKVFLNILRFPQIDDTLNFISELKKYCHLNGIEDVNLEVGGEITTYEKLKLFGSDKDFIFLEYSYSIRDNPMVDYPWKVQFVFTSGGQFIKTINAESIEVINIFPDKNPFLKALLSTGKGNGGHQIYKISGDTLEDVFEGFSDYFPRTYDAHGDHNINEPHELKLSISDINNDNFNDLIFSGKIIYNKQFNSIDDKENNESIPVAFVFLFNNNTGHFIQNEDYSKKYIDLD